MRHDELADLGFIGLDSATALYYCTECYAVFYFHWGRSVECAAEHREKCGRRD